MRKLVLVSLALCASSAFAQKITILPFTGDKSGTAARTQLVTAVCDQAECVNSAGLVTRNRPDPKKLKKSGIAAAVTGSVGVKKKIKTLTLEVFNSGGTSKAKKQFTIDANGLSDKNLATALEAIFKVSGAPKKQAESAAEPEKPAPATPARNEPAPVARAATPAPAPATTPARTSDDVRDEAEPEPAPAPKKKSSDPFLIVDVGADLLNRKFEYVNVVTPNLRRYDLPFFPAIAARAEFYPLAISGKAGAIGGLGVDVGLGLAPYLKSRKASEMEAYPTSMTRFDAGLRFRIVAVKNMLNITPYAGFRLHSFTVAPNSNGVRLDGLPNIAHTGLRLGAQVDVSLLDGGFSIFGRFGVIPAFSAGEIISASFFPKGSDFGIEANAGIGIRLVGPLSARVSFEFARYGMAFTSVEGDPYVADGASDQYLGANVGLRLSL